MSRLQAVDHDVDIVIRLMRTENLSATRMVRLPSRAKDAVFQAKIQSAAVLPGLTRNLYLLQEYLRMDMWSKAADLSQELVRESPSNLQIRKFALLGLCRSDFAEDIERLRASLRDAGMRDICEAIPPDAAPSKEESRR